MSGSARSSSTSSNHAAAGHWASEAPARKSSILQRMSSSCALLAHGLQQHVLELISLPKCRLSPRAPPMVLPAACAALVAMLCIWYPVAPSTCSRPLSSEGGQQPSTTWTFDRLRLAVTLLATFVLGGLARNEHVDLARLMQRRLAASTELLYDLLPRHVRRHSLRHSTPWLAAKCCFTGTLKYHQSTHCRA